MKIPGRNATIVYDVREKELRMFWSVLGND
jgi:hypothetical protein